MDNEIDRKLNVTAILFLLVQNRQQTHEWTLIGLDVIELGILEWENNLVKSILRKFHVALNISCQNMLDWKSIHKWHFNFQPKKMSKDDYLNICQKAVYSFIF